MFAGPMLGAILCLTAHAAAADDVTMVRAATLAPTIWQTSVQLAATIDAQQDATLAAQRAGQVVAVDYQSGETVAAGALLVQLNDAPEMAQLTIDQAKQAQARDALARAEKLITINGASKASLEQARADAAEAAAQVAADEAMVAEDKITAPFAGTLGIRNLAAGDYVSQGQVVARITEAAPLRVLFSIPETEAPNIAVGAAFTVLAPSPSTGHITALAPAVDAATNARAAEGVLNDDTGFVPGSFATISLMTGAAVPAFTVPATALNDSLLGSYIFVVQESGGSQTLHTVYVTELGARGNDAVITAKDLQAGEKVVAIGGFKLSDGAAVTISP
jgi:RND family efflux transporter MFP subunit